MEKVEKKYKNIFRDLNQERDNATDEYEKLKEPFENTKIDESTPLLENKSNSYIVGTLYVSIFILAIFLIYSSPPGYKLIVGSIIGTVLIIIPLVAMGIFFLLKTGAGERPTEKVLGSIGLLTLIVIGITAVPGYVAGDAVINLIKNYNVRDIFILILSLLSGLFLSNSIFGFLGLDLRKSNFFTLVFGFITIILIISKSIAPNFGYESSTKKNIFYAISIIILLALINNENKFISENVLGYNGFSGSLIFLLLIYLGLEMFVIPDGFPALVNGGFTAFFIMMIAVLNEFLKVINIDQNTLYILCGLIATIFGISVAGSVFDTTSIPGKSEFIDAMRKSKEFSFGIFSRVILTILIIASGFIYLNVVQEDISSYDQFEEARKAITFMFPILLIMYFATNIFKAGSSVMSIFYAAATLIIIGLWFYILSKLTESQKDFINYIVGILFIIFVLLSLSMFFLLFGNYLTSMDGMMGIVSNLIFYIPCLIIDIIEWIKNEINNTTPTLGIILILQILVIISYFYLPSIINRSIKSSGIDIIKQPTTISEEVELLGGDRFKMENEITTDGSYSKKVVARRNYCISMWININNNAHNQSALTQEKNIFTYDDKPGIAFKINTDPTVDGESYFIFTLTNQEGNLEENANIKITLPLQKWHYFVFNYNYNTVDVFVNGSLYHSYTFNEKNHPTYDIVTDNIFIGDEDGLSGSICNVTYNTIPLTESEIVNTYNLLNNLNPPIINL